MSTFTLIREQFVREFNGTVREYRHSRTGAEIVSVENGDNNKVFGITFRTPPADSTGVAHILEHTVLCGSRKYPLKDPFVQLLKGSLQTFLNAMTYPDKTVYPVASQNEQDFYNLVDVYLDAVFFPRITPAFFRQEGWHYELDTPDRPMNCKGVVYNEMKGVYSSADSLLLERSQQVLFPDTTYGFDSGGNPADIPTLSYQQFRIFHETFYHPSNARIFFYGNDDPARRLDVLADYLDGFQSLEDPPDTSIALQPPFEQPITVEEPYAAGESESKAYITVNWALPDGILHFALIVLDQILTGTAGSPLRKALIESDLGEDLTGFGLETQLRQPVWSIGLKGVNPADLDAVERLVFQTLESLVRDGIDRDDIDAALNSFEFDLRENNHGSFPQGLSIMLTLLETWLYGWDALGLAAYEHPLAELKQTLARTPRFFEDLIERILLNNPHRATVRLIPDRQKAERDAQEEQQRLEAVRSAMHPHELLRTTEAAGRLLEMQQTPDPPDAYRTLPLLRRSDLSPVIRTVPRDLEERENATVLFHDLFTGGIVYIDIGLNLQVLDADELPWASLLGSLLLETGTTKEDFVSLSRRIARTTGGIHATPFFSAVDGSEEGTARLFLRGKCMVDQTADLLDILSDVLLESAFDNTKRVREIMLEQKADMEGALIPSGHSAVLSRLRAHWHPAHRAGEQLSGIDALFFYRTLQQQVRDDWPGVRSRIEAVLQKLLAGGLTVNVTADGRDRAVITEPLNQFLNRIPAQQHDAPGFWRFRSKPAVSEALLVPSNVNYVGRSINLFDNGYRMHGSALVVSNYLRTAWLWEKIRVQGGAYGAVCSFDPRCGVLAFASYRDPNIDATLTVYNETAQYLKDLKLDDDELTRALIGTIGHVDTYLLPDAKGYADLIRFLTGQTDEKRQRRREEILSTTPEHFRQFGEALNMDRAATSVLASAEAIKKSTCPFDRQINVL